MFFFSEIPVILQKIKFLWQEKVKIKEGKILEKML